MSLLTYLLNKFNTLKSLEVFLFDVLLYLIQSEWKEIFEEYYNV